MVVYVRMQIQCVETEQKKLQDKTKINTYCIVRTVLKESTNVTPITRTHNIDFR
jgi:hypothetical protein